MAKRRRKIDMDDDTIVSVDVEPHKHCVICSRPIPIDQDTCSPACKKEYDLVMKKKRTTVYIFYISIAVFMGILFIQLLFAR